MAHYMKPNHFRASIKPQRVNSIWANNQYTHKKKEIY